ncbi:MAG: hypothetical protein Q6L68_07445, partial [Thermostichus sp. DG02_5_bins_236]
MLRKPARMKKLCRQRWRWGVVLLWGVYSSLVATQRLRDQLLPTAFAQSPDPSTAATTTEQASERASLDWLERYNSALRQLPPLPNLQYRQQVRVEGSQTFTATLDVLYRR